MGTFGLRALLRAIAIFASVYLVKIGIDLINKTDDPYMKIIYALIITALILLAVSLPNIIPRIKNRNPSKDRKPEK